MPYDFAQITEVGKVRSKSGTFVATSADEKFSIWAPRGNAGECWIWTGPLNSNGYGRFQADNVEYLAHRFALERVSLPDDLSLFCCHRCDNPRCVNPAHLFWGSAADNNRDRAFKGRTVTRFVRGDGHPSFGKFGEAHCATKLTAADVAEIRCRVGGGESQTAVARSLGLHSSYVSRISRNLARQEA